MSSKKSSISGGNDANVVRAGFLKKMKTSRKKYFVLRAETPESSARLEYYDSQRKCLNGEPPKRSIPLKNCFNINRRLDTKHKHVIALYTKDDCFCVVLDTEDDVDNWLKALLSLQHGEEAVDGVAPKPIFAHIWQVNVLNRGLGTPNLVGSYRLCLTDKTLSLIKRDTEVPQVELNLINIRSCGNLKDFFFLEIGRSSTLGAGELWMQTEDSNIAQNVHYTVFNAMTAHKEDMAPKSRNRSSSATESSKPNPTGRKQVHGGAPPKFAWSQDVSQATDTQVPSSSSSSQHPVVSGVTSFYHHLFHWGTSKASERRHSISAGGVIWSGIISHQRTQSLPLANPASISDQNTTTSQPPRAAKRSNQSSKCLGGGRERCDSMPSRARTTSEGNHAIQSFNNLPRSHLIPGYRPVSLYGRDISHSPPSGSPVSPPSVGCSTDSAGSSYSLADETDVCTELDPTLNRYSHSLTPDEAIAEEDCPDSPSMLYGASPNNYVPMALHSSDDGYVDMSPRGRGGHNNSPTASLSSVTSGTPSTDMRFAEYPLEKVTSYFAPSEDDDARPTRCYSVGSRPEPHRHKKFIELVGNDSRVRAFSVGSKTKKIPSKVLAQYSYYAPQGVKSSSAPILSNSRVQGSHNSVGPMDDLMEMDFSRSGSINNAGYMDMRPLFRSTNHGYVEMKPVIPENCRVPDTSAYVDMTSGSSPAKPSFITSQSEQSFNQLSDYMDMDQRKNSNNNNNGDYLDMSKTAEGNSGNFQLSPAKVSYMQGSPSCNTIDGYVEMQPGRGHQRQSSLDSAQVANEDYTNMSLGKKQRKPSKKEKARSQPIAIQNATKPSTGSNMYAMLGRKFSTGTPPKMHLPLASCITSPYSSLPRQRSRKNSRRDSKDSSSSSVTTPSSSSTIFPFSLNSPCSPVKPETPVTIKVPPSVLNTTYKKSSSDTAGYIVMDFDKTKSSDYVNYNPASREDDNNYAVMKPLNRVAVGNVDVDTAASRVSNLELDPATDACFRPIKENKEESGENPESADQPSDSGYEVLRTNSIEKSRPTSASSELCSSSGSTIVGSRPESVNSDRVRPASVTSADVQLHYASLDLEDGNRSPRTVKNAGTPAAAGEGGEPTLTYAAIDFVKSEGLKQNPMASGKVVNKH